MTAHVHDQMATALWTKSSYSSGGGNACVEVAALAPNALAVRDSKDISRGAFRVPATSWDALMASVVAEP